MCSEAICGLLLDSSSFPAVITACTDSQCKDLTKSSPSRLCISISTHLIAAVPIYMLTISFLLASIINAIPDVILNYLLYIVFCIHRAAMNIYNSLISRETSKDFASLLCPICRDVLTIGFSYMAHLFLNSIKCLVDSYASGGVSINDTIFL